MMKKKKYSFHFIFFFLQLFIHSFVELMNFQLRIVALIEIQRRKKSKFFHSNIPYTIYFFFSAFFMFKLKNIFNKNERKSICIYVSIIKIRNENMKERKENRLFMHSTRIEQKVKESKKERKESYLSWL